jgi:hypothetical protein
MPAILPKTTVKTIVVRIGWMKNHRGPRRVCLYTETSSFGIKI